MPRRARSDAPDRSVSATAPECVCEPLAGREIGLIDFDIRLIPAGVRAHDALARAIPARHLLIDLAARHIPARPPMAQSLTLPARPLCRIIGSASRAVGLSIPVHYRDAPRVPAGIRLQRISNSWTGMTTRSVRLADRVVPPGSSGPEPKARRKSLPAPTGGVNAPIVRTPAEMLRVSNPWKGMDTPIRRMRSSIVRLSKSIDTLSRCRTGTPARAPRRQ